jgi:predicted XRE-type DNA-binding protein
MDARKRKRLEKAGFAVGDAQDFLKLSDEEIAYIEIKRSLSHCFREKRKAKHLTQVQAAKLLHTSQSRLAKMEHADKSVSIDLLINANLALGTSRQELKHAF